MTKDTLPSPVFDELDAKADEWMAECGVKEMVANIAVVFAIWASPELLARFREQVEAIMHLSFVEGAIRSRDSLPSPVTLSTPDIEKLRELASEMLAALTALYEACERRANEEGGDFGDDIGPAAELADAAIAKAAIIDSLPSPVPEGDARAERERDAWIETARFHARNEEFYRGIVRQIGEMFGEAARTSDDGSIQQDVLALKVPELPLSPRTEDTSPNIIPVTTGETL